MGDQRSTRKAVAADEACAPPVEREGHVWRIRSLPVARQVLRARTATTQAGFTAEAIPQGYFRHHPILVSDGPGHDEQRRKVGRFFAPSVIADRYSAAMRGSAAMSVDRAAARGTCHLDEVALHYSVAVARTAVGLERSTVRGMSRRLESFFRQPPFDITQPDLGRSRWQWAQAAVNGLVPIIRFYLADVRPAVRHLRKHPGRNVISHLIAEGYGTVDILIEAMTYGTAGMVTTREFITMACWHLLDDESLRERYLRGDPDERFAVLHEILRLEPVVGHLIRRVREPLTVTLDEQSWTMQPGELVDVCVRQTNVDTEVVAQDPMTLCPGRDMADGLDAVGLSFSAGAHQCPGRTLAITEADVFLTALLERNPTVARAPQLGWDNLVSGYTLRGMTLAFPASSDHRHRVRTAR